MSGGGPNYEPAEREPPSPDELLLDVRKERIEEVIGQRTRSVCVVLDRLEDTFNMAAVLRTCEGLGIQDVHIIQNQKHPFRPNSKVTQGCDKWLDLHWYEDFAACQKALKKAGYQIWASAMREGGKPLDALEFRGKVALVFGNERFGVSADVLEGCDQTFWIPMRGFSKSFNISAAASATLNRAVSWRAERLGITGDLTDSEKADLKERFYLLSVKQRSRIYGGG